MKSSFHLSSSMAMMAVPMAVVMISLLTVETSSFQTGFVSNPRGINSSSFITGNTYCCREGNRKTTFLSAGIKNENENEKIQNGDASLLLLEQESIQSKNTVPNNSNNSNPTTIKFQTSKIKMREPNIEEVYNLLTSSLIGVAGGVAVATFKLSIEATREVFYGDSLTDMTQSILPDSIPIFVIPALGGLGVSVLSMFGKRGEEFPPGLRGVVLEVDELSAKSVLSASSNTDGREKEAVDGESKKELGAFRFVRKPLAAICTLGTGCSLGPEGPSVELGMSLSRILMNNIFLPQSFLSGDNELDTASAIRRNRLLLSVGAAAGVSAGFNAPLSGVFFALEIVQQALPTFKIFSSSEDSESVSKVVNNEEEDNLIIEMDSSPTTALSTSSEVTDKDVSEVSKEAQLEYLSSGTGSIAPLLLASVISALVSQLFLGEELALSLPQINFDSSLSELPLYLILGAMSGIVATTFSITAQLSKEIFDGQAGPQVLRQTMTTLPKFSKPIIGGLTCGIIGAQLPQILFFGYDTLNTLLANESLSTDLIFTLFVAKTFTTAVSAGSGLVGGTFAPSLFLGGMLGAFFHNVVENFLSFVSYTEYPLSEIPSYAMVGAASVLAALFRAPLTASLLLFETTRDYDVILPLMASAGIGSLIGDVVEQFFEERKNRDQDAVSWGDLSYDEDALGRVESNNSNGSGGVGDLKTNSTSSVL